jgi:ABC-type transport system involved in multi-copper enzyme maturation permease subunit
MIWLTWRQFRVQALAALGLLAALAIYLVIIGLSSRGYYHGKIVGCTANTCSAVKQHFENVYKPQFTLIGGLLIVVPAVIGSFWGAPLVARELEAGTHRLVWNQSVTRAQWLVVKLGLIALVSAGVAGLFSLLLTWSASDYDRLEGSRFIATAFDARNLVPLGYAVFAFVLGTTIGLLIRRTIPAMALTLVLFTAVQVVMPLAVRPHLMPPLKSTVALSEDTVERLHGFGVGPDGIHVFGYTKPGAWVISTSETVVTAAGGKVPSEAIESCMNGGPRQAIACLSKLNLHFDVSYQPGSRYWPFQWIELGLFLVVSLALSGICFWRIPRGVA